MAQRPFRVGIIPLREMEGNYNCHIDSLTLKTIIPLREMEGNYNQGLYNKLNGKIIPLREMEGNYNNESRTETNQ